MLKHMESIKKHSHYKVLPLCFVMYFLWYAVAFGNKCNVVLLAGDWFIVSRFET